MWHAASVFALPFVSLLAGLASLYIDPEREPGKKWILVALLLLSSIGSFTGSLSDDREKESNRETMLNQSESVRSLLAKQDAMAKTQTAMSSTQNDMAQNVSVLLSHFGLDPATHNTLNRILSADTARATVLPAVLSSGASRGITITYYPKNVDGPVVIDALKQGGFRVESGTGNAHNAALATNAIWVGDSVTVEQARFVALTLIRAGINIAAIRRFRSGSGPKASRIEVGTDAALANAPPLTVNQINALTDITRTASQQPDLIT